MKNQSKQEAYSEAKTEARREAALSYALSTPPKPHKAMRKKRVESRKKG